MNRLLVLTGLLLCILSTSCIPHKDIVYLQEKDTPSDSTQVMVEQQKPYRIQIYDILNIRLKVLDQDNVTIFNPVGEGNLNASSAERAYFDGFTVDLHGNIRIPELGKINVLGYNAEDIEKLIKDKLLEEQFKETANIFVTVKLAGLRFTVNGEIKSPGTITLFQERVNIFEAIANAGEIPITGNAKEVQIIRQYPQGQKIHTLDLTDINVMKSPFYYIQPNDIIYIKPLKQKTWGTGTTGIGTITSIVGLITLFTTTLLLIDRAK
ncbi:polysaccharide biosynthesis/export family protein [Psychroserpens jangbogonensis]|uniref:polysaccharide biosynthesis/export family protein n=1 Tax=Psychroserpens jangbogonensis TaxID=1484460 RepID=UPI00053D439A|nr:polysaccharide biosynthesis/export family protein [Psychroserpens jangbogonensis]